MRVGLMVRKKINHWNRRKSMGLNGNNVLTPILHQSAVHYQLQAEKYIECSILSTTSRKQATKDPNTHTYPSYFTLHSLRCSYICFSEQGVLVEYTWLIHSKSLDLLQGHAPHFSTTESETLFRSFLNSQFPFSLLRSAVDSITALNAVPVVRIK